jgi:hypothetical protein
VVVAEIIKALASIAWVAFAFVALFTFKEEIKSSFARLRKGKLFGQEIELRDELDQLQSSVQRTEIEARAAAVQSQSTATPPPASTEGGPAEKVILEAARSPRAALLLLGAELEKTMARIFASSGWTGPQGKPFPLGPGVRKLQEQQSLPSHVGGSLQLFLDVRNKIIHGGAAVEDAEIIRAIDSGLVLLRALNAIPLEQNRVHAANISIFSDPVCTEPFPKGTGVLLETISPGGASTSFRIFPTLKTDYETGRLVAWEWSMDHIWGQAWYRDPATGEIKNAWNSSAEFCGRHLDEIL